MRKIKILFISILSVFLLTGCDKKVEMDLSNVTHVEEDYNDNKDVKTGEFENLFNFEIKFNNELVKVGSSYDDLLKAGWKIKGYTPEKLMNNDGTEFEFVKGEASFVAVLDVNGDYYDSIHKGYLSTINVKGNQQQTVTLPLGITFGKSTMEDVKKAYGVSNNEAEYDDIITWTYGYDKDQYIYLSFHKETQILTDILMSYMKKHVPDIVKMPNQYKNYQRPTALQDEQSMILELDNHFYKPGVTIQEFFDNGWKLDESANEEYDINIKNETLVDSMEIRDMVALKKGESRIYICSKNYEEHSVEFAKTRLTLIQVFNDEIKNMSFQLSPQFNFSFTEEQMKTYLKGKNYEYVEDYKRYELFLNDRSHIEVTFGPDKVFYISLYCFVK